MKYSLLSSRLMINYGTHSIIYYIVEINKGLVKSIASKQGSVKQDVLSSSAQTFNFRLTMRGNMQTPLRTAFLEVIVCEAIVLRVHSAHLAKWNFTR